MASPYQVLYFAALGSTPVQIGLLIGYGTGVSIVTTVIGGYIADTWSKRRIILIFSWVSVVGSFLYVLISSKIFIFIPLTLTSASNIYSPAFTSIMMDEIEPGERIRAFSISNALTAIPSVFSPTIGGLFISQLGTIQGAKAAYLGSFLFGVLGIALRTRMLSEDFVAHANRGSALSGRIRESLVAGAKAVRRSDSTVKRLLLYVALAGIGTGLTSTLAPVFIIDHLAINPTSYSVVVDITGVATLCLYLGVVLLINRIGARRSILLATVASAVSNAVLSQAKTTNELLGWGITGAFYTVLLSPSLSSMQAETIPQQDRGKILAVFSVLPSLAALPSQVLAGALYSAVSPVAPFLACIIPFSAAVLVLYRIE
jgi:MFS family permease